VVDISKLLQAEQLFAYDQVWGMFEFFSTVKPLSSLTNDKQELVLNLCRLSAAELALLDRSILPRPFIALLSPPARTPVEILPRHAFFAIAKTDTSVFDACLAATTLPRESGEGLSVTHFVLFTGDGDKIATYWQKYGTRLVENDPYEDMLQDLKQRYANPSLGNLRYPFNLLDAASSRILQWQLLLIRAKLDVCINSGDSTMQQHLRHSTNFL
jgi:hypothetical protein